SDRLPQGGIAEPLRLHGPPGGQLQELPRALGPLPMPLLSRSSATTFVAMAALAVATAGCASRGAPASDPDAPEWVELFNGRDLSGWTVKIHHHDVGVNFGDTFRVEDGMIRVKYDQYGDFNEQYAHLYYDRPL